MVAEGLSGEGLVWAFGVHGRGANWFPLTWMSHMLDVTLFGDAVGLHKASNVALHALAAALLFAALRLMTGKNAPSALVAGLFAIHPLRAESVVWVAERKDVLSAVFWMATIVAYALYVRRPERSRYLLVLACFALGLMSKSMLVTLPIVLLVLDYWPLRRHRGEAAVAPVLLLREKLPLLAMSFGVAILTVVAQRRATALRTMETFGIAQRIANGLESLADYVRHWAFPTDLGIYYPHRYPTPASIDEPGEWVPALVSLGLLAATSALAFALRRRHPAVLAGWLWYGVALVPVIGLVQVGTQGMADRYTYLPSVGLAIAVAFPLWSWASDASWKRWAYSIGGGAVVLLFYGGLTVETVRHWTWNTELYGQALHAARVRGLPDDGWMHRMLAASHIDAATKLATLRDPDPDRRGKAVNEAREGARLRPADPRAQQTFASTLILNGRYPEAMEAARAALSAAETLGWVREKASAHYTIGIALLRLGRPEPARRALERSLQLDPDLSQARVALASLGSPGAGNQ
jgi:hypothetical protein